MMNKTKKDRTGIILLVVGVLLIISCISLLAEKDFSTAVFSVILAAICLFFGVKRIKNPQPSKKERLRMQKEEEERAKREAYAAALKKKQEADRKKFDSVISAIPAEDIERGNVELSRRQLKDMPEIKTSNIVKTFNPSSLPAFVVIDTETTGLKAATDEIIELSAVIFEDYVPVNTWSTRIKIDSHIPHDATLVNGIEDADLVNMPYLGEVCESFMNFIGFLPIVGYNIGFDLKFLFCSGVDVVSMKQKKYDVLSMARREYRDEIAGGFSLENVCAYAGILHVPHKSLSDCYATGMLFKEIIQKRTNTFIG